jgi:hypothetical protein
MYWFDILHSEEWQWIWHLTEFCSVANNLFML